MLMLGCVLAAGNAPVRGEAAEVLPPTVVSEDVLWLPEQVILKPARNEELRALDAADLLRLEPGLAVVRNGQQTGILQMRGLSGDRVKILVDGMTLTPACPNHMDPPLHYVNPRAVEKVEVIAGITPVSQGGDSLAGTVNLESTGPLFPTNQPSLYQGQIGGFYRGANDGYGFSAEGSAADQKAAIGYSGTWQEGNDLKFPGGTVRDTGYETQQHLAEISARGDGKLWTADGGFGRTRDSGTPALPMDMIKDDSYRVGLRHLGDYAPGQLEARVYFHQIDHLMDNFSLRPVATNMARMQSPAKSEDMGLRTALTTTKDIHTVRAGMEVLHNNFDAYQQNVVTGARQDTLNENQRSRLGLFAEWQGNWDSPWTTLAGVRSDTVWSSAEAIEQWFPPANADRLAFNNADRDQVDANVDATFAVRFTPEQHQSYELGIARKNRAPSLLERYLWTPLSASAGQADGRTYLGNTELESETSHQIAATGLWYGRTWQLKISPFYNWVHNYIQGTPIARLDASGRPVLQFQNFDDVQLYGVEAQGELKLLSWLTAEGNLSYVRGENLDTDDNLYRIAPLHGLVALRAQYAGWTAGAEVEMANEQNQVARYNGELPTPGYALLHLRLGYTLAQRYELSVGVENVLDKEYSDHLGGVNRVLGSDVPVGAHLPGAGRFAYVSLNIRL
jgi:iron complex outermembrane receptor protein